VQGPFPQWTDSKRIVALDPWGHVVNYAVRGDDICRAQVEAVLSPQVSSCWIVRLA
jgi:hypothetical protein